MRRAMTTNFGLGAGASQESGQPFRISASPPTRDRASAGASHASQRRGARTERIALEGDNAKIRARYTGIVEQVSLNVMKG